MPERSKAEKIEPIAEASVRRERSDSELDRLLKFQADAISDLEEYRRVYKNCVKIFLVGGIVDEWWAFIVHNEYAEKFHNKLTTRIHSVSYIPAQLLGRQSNVGFQETYYTINDILREIDDRSKLFVEAFCKFIKDFPHDTDLEKSFAARWQILEDYIRNGGTGALTEIGPKLFPELTQIEAALPIEPKSIPTVAPSLWKEAKLSDEAPPYFIKRVYSEWLDGTLTKADLRRLDAPLVKALDYWLRSNPMPEDVDLPTKADRNTRWIERIREGDTSPLELPGADPITALARLERASRRRRKASEKD